MCHKNFIKIFFIVGYNCQRYTTMQTHWGILVGFVTIGLFRRFCEHSFIKNLFCFFILTDTLFVMGQLCLSILVYYFLVY